MALKTFVKINSITNLSDARYCSGMYVNQLGFNLEENHPDYVSPEKFGEITGWLSGLEYVAEFDTSTPERILTLVQEYKGIQYIQISDETHLDLLIPTPYKFILKCNIQSLEELDQLISKANSFNNHHINILLVSENLSLDAKTLKKISMLAQRCDVLLGFELSAHSIISVLQKTGVKGIALQGSAEIKPGYKDFDELADILEILEDE
jgi:phosphoribosylanthranilate isomerase